MMQFRYRAVNEEGRTQKGRAEAVNPVDLELRLKRLGLQLISCHTARKASRWSSHAIGRRELITFCFHMEQLSRAGVPLLDGLIDLRDSVDHPRFRAIIAHIIESIEGGSQFSQTLAMHPHVFDPVFVNLVRAGEASGQLTEVLFNLTESLKWQDELAAQTKKVLLYPAFVTLTILGAASFLMVNLVPQMVQFIEGMQQKLPLSTRILISASQLISRYGWLLLGGVIFSVCAILLQASYSTTTRLWLDRLKLSIPPIGPILRKIILGRFANYFAMLYAAGVPILDCLQMVAGIVGNRYMSDALTRIGGQISEGQSVTASFERERLFPPLVLRMLRVGENTGALDTAMRSIAYFYNRDIKEAVERVQALIEPVLTVILGALLFWIMSAVLTPIFDTLGKMR